MKFFSSLFHSRDKPQNSTAGSAYRFYMGSSTAGKNVTERSAMQMTAVYSCVRVLSEAVAGLPLHVYKYRSDGGKEKAVTHPLYRLLHDEPNMLAEVKESIMNAYEIKTGMSRAKISHLMDAETWMNANKAVELGFADGILAREEPMEEQPATPLSARTARMRSSS